MQAALRVERELALLQKSVHSTTNPGGWVRPRLHIPAPSGVVRELLRPKSFGLVTSLVLLKRVNRIGSASVGNQVIVLRDAPMFPLITNRSNASMPSLVSILIGKNARVGHDAQTRVVLKE